MTTMTRGMQLAKLLVVGAGSLVLGACHEAKPGECKFDAAQNWYLSYEGDGRWLVIPLIGAHGETPEIQYVEKDGIPSISYTGKTLPASPGHPTGVRDVDAAFAHDVKIVSAQTLKNGMVCVQYSRAISADSRASAGPQWAVWEPALLDLVKKESP